MQDRVDTLVIGGGQAGIAMSEHLRRLQIPHLVLERGRIAERWRSRRWDSLVANGPAWHDRFPGMAFEGMDPEAFPGKEEVADYFAAYAARIEAPVRTGVEVTALDRAPSGPGFVATTSEGTIRADHVVVATGAFQKPIIPPMIPEDAGLHQLHSADYRNPGELPPGAVLVVGSGSSGAQIADELNRAGRRVFLSVGPHGRPPRTYRGHDYCWWLGVLGLWDVPAPTPGTEHVTIAVSGAHGGETVDFRRLGNSGITLLGRTEGYADGRLRVAPDLAANIAGGDEDLDRLLDACDAYAERMGLDLPPEPEARQREVDPPALRDPILSLDLAAEGVTTVIWATGYAPDYGWIHLDVCDASGRPIHQRGVSNEPGLYFLGLPWQSRRGSSFIWGVWHDAAFLAEQIGIQHSYRAYHQSRPRRA